MNKIATKSFVILKGVIAAFVAFIAFALIYGFYLERERAKILRQEQIESTYEYMTGTWKTIDSSGADDKTLNGVLTVKFDEHQNCVISFVDHSEYGTYSLDVHSLYVDIKSGNSSVALKRYSYEYLLTYLNGIYYLTITNNSNNSIKFKRIE